MFGRDFGLAWRFHTIAAGDLTWKRAFRTDIMCAFTSAITPSVVGGSALAIFYLNREGIGIGRATALTLTTLFLDELFFVIFCPIIVLIVPLSDLFTDGGYMNDGANAFLGGVEIVFWLVYAGIVIWTAILYVAIIARPEGTSRVLEKISQWRILRRFSGKNHDNGRKHGCDFAMGERTVGALVAECLRLYCAFMVFPLFRCLLPVYGICAGASQLLVFARQFVVWVVLMVSPTPGGSGISEWLFATYYGDLIGNVGMAAVLALVWRLLSYYIYIIAGCSLLPGYFGENKKTEK